MTFRVVVRLASVLVLVVSGVYMLVYLYRWEWNRALISGIFFVAAEIALATALIVGRLQALDTRLSQRDRAPEEAHLRARLRESNTHPSRAFVWLKASTQRTNVFVPILMGSGVVLAALAYVGEQLSMLVSTHTVDRRLARTLAGLQPPSDGLLAPADAGQRRPARPVAHQHATRFARLVLLPVLLLAAVVVGIDALGDLTQSRPQPLDHDAITTIDVRVTQRGVPRPLGETASALWTSCAIRLPHEAALSDLIALDGASVRLVVEPGLDNLRTKRLIGCLQDATLDLVQARVISYETVPRDERVFGTASE